MCSVLKQSSHRKYSKFGIEIPLVDDEDLKIIPLNEPSPLLWSTAWLPWEIVQQANVAGRGEVVEMKIWNLQSLLVCPIILCRVSSTEDDWIFGWRSRLILILCSSLSLVHCGWMERLLDRWTALIQFLRTTCWWWRIWIGKNVSRFTMWCPKCLAAHRCGSGFPENGLAFPSGIGWGGNDTGRLVTWEFRLQIDSASLHSSESLIPFISFCNSCIGPESSKTVFWSSTDLRRAIVSKVELWNFFNLPFHRNSKFCCNNCARRSCWSRRWSSSVVSARWSSSCCQIFVKFFCHKRVEIRVCWFLPDSARIRSFYLSSKVQICASWLFGSASRHALSPTGRSVLSDTDDNRPTDNSSRWEGWPCTRWASRSIPSSAASSYSVSRLSERNGGKVRSSV